jgi:hypothetical protein
MLKMVLPFQFSKTNDNSELLFTGHILRYNSSSNKFIAAVFKWDYMSICTKLLIT